MPVPDPLALKEHFPPVSTEAWRDQMLRDLGRMDPARPLQWITPDGFAIDPVYRSSDATTFAPAPGRSGPWHIRQDIGAGSIVAANKEARAALEQGATAIGFVAPQNRSPVTKGDVADLLDGIPLEATPVHWEGFAKPGRVVAGLFAVANAHTVPQTLLKGAIGCDPAGRLARTGVLHVEAAYDELGELVGMAKHAQLHTVCMDAHSYHMAGATCAHELGCLLGAASEAVAQLTERGFPANMVIDHMWFRIPVASMYLMAISKMRALHHVARQLFAAFGVTECLPVVDAVTSSRSYSLLDPPTNLLRMTIQAMAAIMGGCRTLTVQPHNRSSDAQRLARNVQRILRHEAHLGIVADPAAGSYYIETFTEKIAKAAWAFFQELEERGGLLEALKAGFIQRAIRKARQARFEELAAGRRMLVGVNTLPTTLTTGDVHIDAMCAQTAGHPAATADASLAVEPLPCERDAERFEALRLRTEALCQAAGRRLRVHVLDSMSRVVAGKLFGWAGFEIEEHSDHTWYPDVVVACSTSAADLPVLPETDECAPQLVLVSPPAFAEQARRVTRFFVPDDADMLLAVSVLQDALAERFQHAP